MQGGIQNANITISSVEDTGTQIKIKDEQGHTWSFFKNKQSGEQTVAFEQFQSYKIGEQVGVGYKMAGQKGTIRSIMNFGAVRSDLPQYVAPRPNSGFAQPPRGNGRPAKEWLSDKEYAEQQDKRAYEKCCSIWAAQILSQYGANAPGLDVFPSQKVLDLFWRTFQAIRADGEKRFASGWAKAEAVFKPQEDELPPIEAYTNEG